MNFNKILQSLFGNKSTRDMKLIQPIVEKIKAEYPKMQALSNDELRAKTKELQKYVQEYAKEEKAKIATVTPPKSNTMFLIMIYFLLLQRYTFFLFRHSFSLTNFSTVISGHAPNRNGSPT
jgi:membrane protein insertase Oxa1/YidC/SpoIIIJ